MDAFFSWQPCNYHPGHGCNGYAFNTFLFFPSAQFSPVEFITGVILAKYFWQLMTAVFCMNRFSTL